MIRGYRLVNPRFAHQPLSGEGARITGGRWNPKGVSVLYLATSPSLAALEKLVHMPLAARGNLLTLLIIEVPEASLGDLDVSTLPANWRDDPAPPSLGALGQAWVTSGQPLTLRVPSVLTSEKNMVVNIAHPDMHMVRHVGTEDFRFDSRVTTGPVA